MVPLLTSVVPIFVGYECNHPTLPIFILYCCSVMDISIMTCTNHQWIGIHPIFQLSGPLFSLWAQLVFLVFLMVVFDSVRTFLEELKLYNIWNRFWCHLERNSRSGSGFDWYIWWVYFTYLCTIWKFTSGKIVFVAIFVSNNINPSGKKVTIFYFAKFRVQNSYFAIGTWIF